MLDLILTYVILTHSTGLLFQMELFLSCSLPYPYAPMHTHIVAALICNLVELCYYSAHRVLDIKIEQLSRKMGALSYRSVPSPATSASFSALVAHL